jgi:ABC-2 type transport system permease protein
MNLHGKYIAFKTILIKEFLRFTRIWIQTVLPPAITMSLYFIIFGNLIGAQIGSVHGFTYMEYIVPGLIMLGIIANSYANVVSSFFGAKFQHHIEEMLVSPTPNYVILLGFISGGVMRGLTVGCVVFLVSLIFTHLQIHNLFVTVSVVFLTSTLFSLAGFINGVFARSFDDISIVPTFVLTPLTYLGGIFYSIDMLSPFWRRVSMINPILYMINAFRYGILGISDINVLASFAIIIGFIVALFMMGLYLLDRGVGIRT